MSSIRREVPPGETPAEACDHCGQPFATEMRLVLHNGHQHYQLLDETEQNAFDTAREDEKGDLRLLQLKAIIGLVFLYFGFLFMYAIFA
jgi:hypothetical protein